MEAVAAIAAVLAVLAPFGTYYLGRSHNFRFEDKEVLREIHRLLVDIKLARNFESLFEGHEHEEGGIVSVLTERRREYQERQSHARETIPILANRIRTKKYAKPAAGAVLAARSERSNKYGEPNEAIDQLVPAIAGIVSKHVLKEIEEQQTPSPFET